MSTDVNVPGRALEKSVCRGSLYRSYLYHATVWIVRPFLSFMCQNDIKNIFTHSFRTITGKYLPLRFSCVICGSRTGVYPVIGGGVCAGLARRPDDFT